MYGAILGDIIGSPYEFDYEDRTKDFPLFSKYSTCTDDSVLTIAVAQALMESGEKPDEEIRKSLVRRMQEWGNRYPYAGYGSRFILWLRSDDPQPYGSYGNGSAMRVSSAGWLYDSLEETRRHAVLTAEVTHSHPEGIKGAESVAAAIYLARTGSSKEEIHSFTTDTFSYDLGRTCEEIRAAKEHTQTCQQTVPQAITAFLEGDDFEDTVRNAVSLGGDTDTLACIAGAIAEAYFGVPDKLQQECRDRLKKGMLPVLEEFDRRKKTRS